MLLYGEFVLEIERLSFEMKPWRLDCALNIHPEIDQIYQHLQDCAANAIGAAGTGRDRLPAIREEQRWRHHRGDTAVFRPAMKTVRVDVLLTQHVVEHDAGTRQHITGAFAIGEGHARHIPAVVGDADLSGSPVAAGMSCEHLAINLKIGVAE